MVPGRRTMPGVPGRWEDAHGARQRGRCPCLAGEDWGLAAPVLSPGGSVPRLCGDLWPCMAVLYQEVVLGPCALGLGRTRALGTPGFGHAAFSREPSVPGGCEGPGEAMPGQENKEPSTRSR